MMKIISKHFKHYIKKKEAFKVEPIPELEERTIYGKYRQSYSICKGKITCCICGFQAAHVAYFQAQGCRLVEKYCQVCLDKYVICSVTDESLPPSNK